MKKLDLIARPSSAPRRRSLGSLALLIGTALPAASALSGCSVEQAEADAGLAELAQPLTGTDLTPTLPANVSNLRGTAPGGEGINAVYDNNASTKLLLYGRRTDWIQYQMTRPSVVTNYDLTSANDEPGRDPKTWTLEGSNDGVGWKALDSRVDQVFSGRGQTRSFSFANTTAYLFYRLNISANNGKDDLQLAELRIGGSQTTGTVPGTPSTVTATANANAITVTWSAATNATSYILQRISDNGQGSIEIPTSGTSFTDTQLAPGTTYLYQVQAVRDGLRGFPSTRGRARTAAAPGGLKDVTALTTFLPTSQHAGYPNEEVSKLTDNNPYTKYFTPNASGWIRLQTAPNSVVTQYTLTSANDNPVRDPKKWKLEGSPDGSTWTTLDTRADQSFTDRFQKRVYTCNPNSLPFTHYRLTIEPALGEGTVQLAEWRLLGATSANLAAPIAPSGLAATALTGNQIRLSWTDNAGQLNPESHYRIERATNSSFTANLVTKTTGANSTQFRASALAQNTTYFFRISAVNAAGASAVVGPVSAVTPSNAPPEWFVETDWYDFGAGGHNRTVYRTYQDDHVAIYYDQYVTNRANATWLNPIMSQAWQYIKTNYGHFSDPILYVIGNQANVPGTEGWFGGGGVQYVYDPFYYRNIAFVGAGDWTTPDYGWGLHALTHEIGHLVESNNNEVSGSPSFGVWGDSKWAEIFQYDVHLNVAAIPSGIAAQTAQDFMTSADQYGRFWFRDWYLPLYKGELGNSAPSQKGVAVLSRYFQLLAAHLPQIDSRFDPRSVNLGELVHFYSGAAGVNLESRARIAFRWTPEAELQFAKAQVDFPAVTALYQGGSCTPETNAAFCGRLAATCGSVTAADNCGTQRTVSSCGTCTAPQTCGGGGTPNACGESVSNTPCSGLCSNPVVFSSSFPSGNLGTSATCHETTSNLQGFNCGNFAPGRTFRVNNVLATCNYNNQPLPAKRNGGYCFQASAGDFAWASATTF